MVFEYDAEKSAANKSKHGVDFESARALWDDPQRISIPSRLPGEPRQLVIGKLGGRLWTAIITYRETAIRIISVRRSRDEERSIYESS